jgi:PKD repeat protein
MKRELLFFVFTLTLVASITDRIYACCEKPVADFTVTPATDDVHAGYFVCIHEEITFDGSSSYDPDNVNHSCADIESWEWDFGDGETGTGETTTHTYDDIGEKTVELTVTDNDSTCCCPAEQTSCTNKTDSISIPVTVVKVLKVVKSGTTDEGPLYLCLNDTVDLEAKSDPEIESWQWPPDSPFWTVIGPSGSDPSLDPEDGSPTTTLSGLTIPGDYAVLAKCCSSCTAIGDYITVTAFKINSTTYCDEPLDTDRTQLGLGEKVLCSVPIEVEWSLDGPGSVFPKTGTSTTFTASKTVSDTTVHAQTGTIDCTLDFEVIAPDGMEYSPDDADTGGYPLTEGPPADLIGNGRVFPITIQPTTVSFHRLDFRENIPEQAWEWPDGTDDVKEAVEVDFDILCGNDGIDNISHPPDPYARLHNGTQYVSFSYTIEVPLEYKNENGQWIEFMSGNENYHEQIFTASGECSLKVTADNTQESDPRGPWQQEE